MTKLKFRFDEDGDFVIWKGEDDPIAFTYRDLPKLIGSIASVIYGNETHSSFNRINYGNFKIDKYDSNKCRIYGNKGFYFCTKQDLSNNFKYLEDLNINPERLDEQNISTAIKRKIIQAIEDFEWSDFMKALRMILLAVGLGSIFDNIGDGET